MTLGRRRSDQLLKVLDNYESVVVLTHDTPDPDAIASGWALHALVREKLRKPVRVIGRGAIVRAENVRMVELLRPPLELLDRYEVEPNAAAVLVDCSPGGTNQPLFDGHTLPVAFIDHHVVPGSRRVRVEFRDLRPRASASASIVASYLREQGVEPGKELATALHYAMHSEVVATPAEFSRAERGVFAWLSRWVDHGLLRRIADAPLSMRYFEDLSAALDATWLFDAVAFTIIDDAGSPEIVGEVADLLIRCRPVHRVFCGAIVGGELICSARTTAEGGDAVVLLGKALADVGHWGGHPHRAGGKVSQSSGGHSVSGELVEEIRRRWLEACGVEGTHGTHLVKRSHQPW